MIDPTLQVQLDRLTQALAERDATIADLSQKLAKATQPVLTADATATAVVVKALADTLTAAGVDP